MHQLLDEDTLLNIHSGTYTDRPLLAEAFLVVGSSSSKQVKVNVRDSAGQRVGELTNGFQLVNDEAVVRYHFVQLEESVRGHGFARSYYGRLEGELRLRDAATIQLRTWQVGGYLFGALGFDFDLSGVPAHELALTRQMRLRQIVDAAQAEGVITPEEFAILEPHLYAPEASRPAALSRPLEITKLSRDLSWRIFGGLQWRAIKQLA